jgi:hypothetical protein
MRCLEWVLSWRKRASSELIDGDVVGRFLALGLERVELVLQGLDLFLQRRLTPQKGLDMLRLDGLFQGQDGELGQAPGALAGGRAHWSVQVAIVGVDCPGVGSEITSVR